MKYLSVCSGIEAATCAWHPLGWEPVAFSEIEAFPSAVLKHHYPTVPNLGDMTRFKEWPDATFDVLVGGTPCQSFSVAGLRKGLADPRGNLALVYLALADRYRPEWLVWENVPGVLSSAGGRDFGSFLGALGQLGYGWAYRVLDAQYFGLAQRRRRVFVVANLGGWQRAAAVLFESACLSGSPAPSREAGQRPAPTIAARTRGGGGLGTDLDCDGGLIPSLAGCLQERDSKGVDSDTKPGHLIPVIGGGFDVAPPLTSNPYGDHESREGLLVAHTLKGEGFDASEDGTGRGTPPVPVAVEPYTLAIRGRGGDSCLEFRQDGTANALLTPSGGRGGMNVGAVAVAHAFDARQSDVIQYGDKTGPLDTCGHSVGAQTGMAVRRLTPRECERLQGFPDDFTQIPWRKKPAADCPDGPRYKALGNSMAVPCMSWIGERIAAVSAIELKVAA